MTPPRRQMTVQLHPLPDGAHAVIASEPVAATGCCGAMHAVFVSRDGTTRCVACDRRHTHQEQNP